MSDTPRPKSELRSISTSPEHLQRFAAVLSRLSEMTRESAAGIKGNCTEDGEFQPECLDRFQLECHGLAFCEAEIAAGRVMLDYGDANRENPFILHLVLLFVSETIKSVLNRFLDGNLQLHRKFAQEVYSDSTCMELLDFYSRSHAIAAVGEQLVDMETARLPGNLDHEKELVRETFQRFADEVVAPLAEKIHRQDLDIPEEIIKPAAELGCFGTCIPERFGGLQPDDRPDSLGMIVVTEELSRGSLGAAGSLITRPEIAARALLAGGTEAQQQHWLPRLASGEMLCAISITEPNTGSDVAAVSLRATPTEGGWLLNGSKTWCTYAGRSELLVVLARTDPDTSLGHRGLSMFLLEKPPYPGHAFQHVQDQGGALTGRAIPTIGYRGMHSFDLFFEDYFVPSQHLLGEESGLGRGFYYTMAGFAGGRIQTAARATGVMQAAYEKALGYARERRLFGQSLGDFQLTRIKLARMLATITACRQFSYSVARQLDTGGGQMEASLVKLFACRAAEWITREALQIHGGMGYAEESAVSRYFVDARVLSIFEGAEEVLAIKVIARELIARA